MMAKERCEHCRQIHPVRKTAVCDAGGEQTVYVNVGGLEVRSHTLTHDDRRRLASMIAAIFEELWCQHNQLRDAMAIINRLPSGAKIQLSIAIVKDSINTHLQWREHRLHNPKDNPLCGDLEHHNKCLSGYRQVIRTLNATRQAATAAQENR